MSARLRPCGAVLPKALCIAADALWLALIFSLSLTGAPDSTVQSQAAVQQLDSLLAPFSAAPVSEVLVRKLAHFAEFGVAGVLAALTLAAFAPTGGSRPAHTPCAAAALTGLVIALADETLQLTSPGRAAQVTDVWLDWAGYLTGAVLCGWLLWLLACRKKAVNDAKAVENNNNLQ